MHTSFFKKIFSLLCVLTLISACQKKASPAPQKQEPLTVSAVKTQQKEVPLSFEYTGKAQGSKETEVRARVGGILMKRNYVEGSKVQEGQLLFEIDRAPYKIALDKAAAELNRQKADLNAAEKQYDRVKTLGEKGFSSQKAVDEAEARVLAIRAAIAVAKASLNDAKLNYEYTLVTAPISGITGSEVHSEGSLISTAGENSLLTTITQLNPVYVVFSASDNELFRLADMIQKGLVRNAEQGHKIRAKIQLNDGEFYENEGMINFINPAVDQATGTLKLRAEFENPKGKILPGQFVRVTLDGLSRQNAIALPKAAVLQGAKGSFVYVVDAQGKVAVRLVKTGYTAKNGDWVVDEGLNADETVILDNFVKIKEGMPVKVKYVQEETVPPTTEQAEAQTETQEENQPENAEPATTVVAE